MGKFTKKSATILLIAAYLMFNCNSYKEVTFISGKSVISNLTSNKANNELEDIDLRYLLYLNPDLANDIKPYLNDTIQIEDYIIEEAAKEKLVLKKKYILIKNVILDESPVVSEYLNQRYGIQSSFKKSIVNPVIINDKKAFVRFATEEGSIYGLIFEMQNSSIVKISVGFIITT